MMNSLRAYGYSDCVFCDIVTHQPWEPASFVYEDNEVAVFHNVLGWLPVMLLAVPRRSLAGEGCGTRRHVEQEDLWRKMGSLGGVAVRIGREHCRFDGKAQFRLVSNIGPLAMQSQSHAHLHILGTRFQPSYPDLRAPERLMYEDNLVRAYRGELPRRRGPETIQAVMIVPREPLTQDSFFARMDTFGPVVLEIARSEIGESYRLLAEVGPHAPVSDNGAHLFVLGGTFLGHYV
jgi:diadenosine tetraphosphate (Ap4A) HIT family hydrolase